MRCPRNVPAVRRHGGRTVRFMFLMSILLPAAVHAAQDSRPCASLPEARQFDFWVGRWEVRDTSGRIAGTNEIQLILGDCVLLENWTGARGVTGKSLNTFNKSKRKWQQTWVDDHGEVIEFVDGEYKDGAMRFRSESREPDGKLSLRRLSFHNLGKDKVRQLCVQSLDGGHTWTPEYDLTYSRIR